MRRGGSEREKQNVAREKQKQKRRKTETETEKTETETEKGRSRKKESASRGQDVMCTLPEWKPLYYDLYPDIIVHSGQI